MLLKLQEVKGTSRTAGCTWLRHACLTSNQDVCSDGCHCTQPAGSGVLYSCHVSEIVATAAIVAGKSAYERLTTDSIASVTSVHPSTSILARLQRYAS